MDTESPNPEIERLLAELRSDDPGRRNAALDKIAERKVQNAEIVGVIKTLTKADRNEYVRYRADQTLRLISAKDVGPLSRRAKIVQFAIGFVGWYLVNGLAWAVPAQQPGFTLQGIGIESYGILGLCLWPANLLALIFLTVYRPGRWIALGLLAAIALNFIVALIIGASTGAYCFIPFFMPGLR